MKVFDKIYVHVTYKKKLHFMEVAKNSSYTATSLITAFIDKFINDRENTIQFLFGEKK